MQPQVPALIDTENLFQFFSLGIVFDIRERLQPQHLRINLHKLDAVCPIHMERIGEFLYHRLVVCSLHAPVDFIQHDHVRRLKRIKLRAELVVDSCIGFLTFGGFALRFGEKSLLIGKGELDVIEFQASLDVPLHDPQGWSPVIKVWLKRFHTAEICFVVDKRGSQ